MAAGLSTFLLAGILSAFLLVGKAGFASSNYSEMEGQLRTALDLFGDEARKAADIRWHDERTITLAVVTATSARYLATYAYDPDPRSPTHGSFYRVLGDRDSTQPRRVLVRGVAPDFAFQRFKLETPTSSDNVARSDLETKQIQVTLRAARGGTQAPASTQSAISARYILRNKRVSN